MRLLIVLLIACTSFLYVSSANAVRSSDNYEHWIHVQINRERHRHELVRTHQGSCVDHYAEQWVSKLVKIDILDHSLAGSLLTKCDISWSGEILARGNKKPREIVQAWMNSPSHRNILLDSRAHIIGVGAVKENDVWIIVVNFAQK